MGLFNKKEKTEEEKLVDELVGSGFLMSSKVIESLFISGNRMELQKTVKNAWKNGASCEQIQKVYDGKLAMLQNLPEEKEKKIKKEKEKLREEEKPIDFQIKKILGGWTWTVEVGDLFKKYNRGSAPEQAALKQVKEEAKEGKIQPNEYLNRLEELLSELPSKDEVKKIKEAEKAKKEIKKAKEERIKSINKSLFHPEKPNLFDETLDNAIKFETKTWGSGLISTINLFSFNSYQQLMAKSQETQIIANRIMMHKMN